MERYFVEKWEFKNIRDALMKSGEFFILGTDTLFCPTVKTKWVVKSACYKWGEEFLTPGEIAKRELDRNFPKLLRVGWHRDAARILGYRLPMFCTDEYVGQFVHVDIVSAYCQAYSRQWLDVKFPCGLGGKYDMSPVAHALYYHKKARNAVIGLCRSTRINAIKNGRSISLRSTNKYLSPGLWGTICTWLNELAWEARDLGAVYCMVDGYFFPMKSRHQEFLDLLDDYGIDYRTSVHRGHIMGWLSYSMSGGKTTHPYTKNARGRINHIKLYAGHPLKIVNYNYKDVLNYRLKRYS